MKLGPPAAALRGKAREDEPFRRRRNPFGRTDAPSGGVVGEYDAAERSRLGGGGDGDQSGEESGEEGTHARRVAKGGI